MRKIISALLAVAVAVPMTVCMPVSAANSAWQSDNEMITLLSELNIMTGDDNGDFYLDSYVTRAEMAKIAVASSSYKNTVAAGLQFSPFSDVKGSYWAAPYIQAAVSAGIVEGYIDGTFNPGGAVTYEEAITMMLKVLGYTNDDFGASYPYGQVGMAQNLEMTDGMNAAIGEQLTRRQVALLVCNTLDTAMKESGRDLITVHNCQILDDVTIIASQNEDSTLSSDEISTTSGKYRIDESFDMSYVGLTGDMVVKDGKYFVAFSSGDENLSEKYVIYSILNNALLCYAEGDNTTIHQFDISSSTVCYQGSTATTYAALSSSMEMGDVIRVKYKTNGEIDYINYSEGNVEGPIKVTSDSWINSFDTNSSTKFVREGVQVDSDSIQTNDIIYYSNELNMVLAYTTKVTGVYESATPSKDVPQSVTISGVTYELEGVEAFNDLSSNGSFNYGDTVTVLLGRDGTKIAGVVTASSAITSQAGYVIDTGRKEFSNADGTTYTSYYVTIVTPDSTTYTYPTTYNVSSSEGKAVRVQLKDGKATVGVINSSSELSGYVSYENMRIGSYNISKDVKILDIADTPTVSVPLYTKTYMQRIDGLTLTGSQVAYFDTDSNGEVSEIILKNVTGDMYSYGLVTSSKVNYSEDGTETSSTMTINDGTNAYTITNSGAIAYGNGVQFVVENGAVSSKIKLPAYSGAVSELTSAYATIGGNDYKLSDKVIVFEQIDISHYEKISMNTAMSGDYSYTCYYDKAENKGGRIRVIVAKKNS